MTNQQGTEMASTTFQGNNFAKLAHQTLQCGNTAGHWEDGYFNINLNGVYDYSMGDVTIRVTSTLDQGASDESIGIGDMRIEYDYDPSVEWVQPNTRDYDEGESNPTSLWTNNCGATEKECYGFKYFGGHGQCARGHTVYRVFSQNEMPGCTEVRFTGRIWTIDSWDGETFTVEMTDKHGNVLDTATYQGNNFARLADETV
jgi:hypothetical protein